MATTGNVCIRKHVQHSSLSLVCRHSDPKSHCERESLTRCWKNLHIFNVTIYLNGSFIACSIKIMEKSNEVVLS